MLRESLLYIGLSQSLFAAFVLGTRQKVQVADRILVFCLLTIALRFLIKTLSISEVGPDFSLAIIPMSFGPFLYLYTTYLIKGSPKFNFHDLWHFAPAIFFITSYLLFFEEVISLNVVTYFEKDSLLWVRIVFGLTFFSSVLIYTILTFVRLNDYRKTLTHRINTGEASFKLLWLNFIALLFSIIFLTYLVVGLVNAVTFAKTLDLGLISHIGLTVLAYTVSYFGLRQPSIFLNLYNRKMSAQGADLQEIKPLKKPNVEELVSNLDDYMKRERPYLNPELTLTELAKELNMKKSELTHLLNNHLGKNFFSYVNSYRLEAVLAKLEDPASSHLTILSIAYDSGFNSKSTFNGLFKQYTGLTPTEYKRKASVSSAN